MRSHVEGICSKLTASSFFKGGFPACAFRKHPASAHSASFPLAKLWNSTRTNAHTCAQFTHVCDTRGTHAHRCTHTDAHMCTIHTCVLCTGHTLTGVHTYTDAHLYSHTHTCVQMCTHTNALSLSDAHAFTPSH